MKKDEKTVELPPGDRQVEVNFTTPPRPQGRRAAPRRDRGSAAAPTRSRSTIGGTSPSRSGRRSRSCSSPTRPIDADFVAAALDPDATPAQPQDVPGRPESATRPRRQVSRHDLAVYACVFLLNVDAARRDGLGRCSTATSTRGAAWSSALGDRCRPENYNGPIASQILPAQLGGAQSRQGRDAPSARSPTSPIPLFQTIRQGPGDPARARSPVYRYWGSQGAGDGAGLARCLTLRRRRPGLARADVQGPEDRPRAALDAPRWPAAPAASRPRTPGTSSRCRAAGRSSVLMNLTVPYLAGHRQRAAQLRGRRERAACTLEPTAPLQELPWSPAPTSKTTDRSRLRPAATTSRCRCRQHARASGPSRPRTPRTARPVLGFSVNPPQDREPVHAAGEAAISTRSSARTAIILAEDAKALKDMTSGSRVGIRDLSLAHVPDPDRRDAGELPGQHVLQGIGRGRTPAGDDGVKLRPNRAQSSSASRRPWHHDPKASA